MIRTIILVFLILSSHYLFAAKNSMSLEAANNYLFAWNSDANHSKMLKQIYTADFIQSRGQDRLINQLEQMRGEDGELLLRKVLKESKTHIEFLASNKKDLWLNFSLTLDPEQSFKIKAFSILMAVPPIDEDDIGLSPEQLKIKIAQYMKDKVANHEFSGSIILMHGSKVLFSEAYGITDLQLATNNTLDTPFNLGSMNKMFTGLAITQLVESGKIKFTDMVGKYLPNYPNRQVRDQVSIHQLLTHTAGLGSYWNRAYEINKNKLSSMQGFTNLFQNDDLVNKPGVGFHYSNAGPVVLALIIEKVTRMTYFQYVNKYIYHKAGMKHSGHFDKYEKLSKKATGYMKDSENEYSLSNFESLGRIGSAAGGGYASANDLVIFSQKLYDGTLISEKYRRQMIKGKVKLAPDFSYGYLFGVREINNQKIIGHNGSSDGVSADFLVFPDTGYTLIVLSNFDKTALKVSEEIRTWIAYATSNESSFR